ncbi:RNA polymerase sigma factor [Pleionea sp. CnH1-48]|uniref:RNA polymerase sigma factor n=1 Tax=Pleionea sp. CnH1-48 TaxID=2954494 RepID=UPI002097C4EF|nr:sigma-70 family RNA polymerase sigma factor [Pleionea sp. CnH1-48]MCO7224948.1 sigma-70 family RNA polymerase sigma factor [Pleionea sp. CnH1-48]
MATLLSEVKRTHQDYPVQLIQRIRSGERQAEQELVTHYWQGLYFILNRRAQDPELARDIVQDAFIVVLEKARNDQIKNPAALSAFIREVGVNLLIAHYRKEKRRATDTDPDIDIRPPESSSLLNHSLHNEKLLEIVQQLMDEMKVERDREILRRYFISEQTKKEICEALDLTPAQFDRILHRARSRLKQLILFKLSGSKDPDNTTDLLSIVLLTSLSVPFMYQAESSITTNQLSFFAPQVREPQTLSHLYNQETRIELPFHRVNVSDVRTQKEEMLNG